MLSDIEPRKAGAKLQQFNQTTKFFPVFFRIEAKIVPQFFGGFGITAYLCQRKSNLNKDDKDYQHIFECA